MNEHELKSALFTVGLFAFGAVALIMYQHSLHTSAIMSAVSATGGGAGASASYGNTSGDGSAIKPASLAGTPSAGQLNLVAKNINVSPLAINSNWEVTGE